MVETLQDSEARPIDATTPTGRCLVWVADGGADGKGAWRFGSITQYSDGPWISADGHNGDWKITHWLPIPAPPNPN